MPSTLLSAAELASMRDAVSDLLPASCVIERPTEASDGQGGMLTTYAAVGTVDCRIAARSGRERLLAGQNMAMGAYVVTLPHGTDIQPGDRVTVNVDIYRITFVDDAKDWLAAVRADADVEVP